MPKPISISILILFSFQYAFDLKRIYDQTGPLHISHALSTANWSLNPPTNYIQKIRPKKKLEKIVSEAAKTLHKNNYRHLKYSGPNEIEVVYESKGNYRNTGDSAQPQRVNLRHFDKYRIEKPTIYLDALVQPPFDPTTTPAPVWSEQPAIRSKSSQSWHSLSDPKISIMRERLSKKALPELNEMDAILADQTPSSSEKKKYAADGRIYAKSKRNDLYGSKKVRNYLYEYDYYYPSVFH